MNVTSKRFGTQTLLLSTLYLLVFYLNSCATQPHRGAAVDFESEIKPLLELNCLQCHNSRINHGHLILESRALAFRPRPGGPVIIPGNADASLVYSVIRFPDVASNAMPPTRHRLDKEKINLLYRWIEEGAPWPDGDAGALRPPPEEYPYPPVDHPALRQG